MPLHPRLPSVASSGRDLGGRHLRLALRCVNTAEMPNLQTAHQPFFPFSLFPFFLFFF